MSLNNAYSTWNWLKKFNSANNNYYYFNCAAQISVYLSAFRRCYILHCFLHFYMQQCTSCWQCCGLGRLRASNIYNNATKQCLQYMELIKKTVLRIIILIVQHRFQFIYLPSGDATSCIVFCTFSKPLQRKL